MADTFFYFFPTVQLYIGTTYTYLLAEALNRVYDLSREGCYNRKGQVETPGSVHSCQESNRKPRQYRKDLQGLVPTASILKMQAEQFLPHPHLTAWSPMQKVTKSWRKTTDYHKMNQVIMTITVQLLKLVSLLELVNKVSVVCRSSLFLVLLIKLTISNNDISIPLLSLLRVTVIIKLNHLLPVPIFHYCYFILMTIF